MSTKTVKVKTTTTKKSSSGMTKPVPQRRRPRSGRRNPAGAKTSGALGDWINTLNDPFDAPPITLGFGTFASTSLATAYYHNTLNSNVDGSFALLVNPDINNGIKYCTSGATSAVWGQLQVQNLLGCQQLGDYYRVVSYGVRAAPLVASTATPGTAWAGSIALNPATVLASSNLDTPTLLAAAASSRSGLAQYGVTMIGRPIFEEAGDFLFTTTTTGLNTNGWESVYIVFKGLPTQTTILFEIVMNIEVLPGQNQLVSGNMAADNSSVAYSFPTFGSAFRAALPKLSNATLMDFNATNNMFQKFGNSANIRRMRNLSKVAVGAGTGSRAGGVLHDLQKEEERFNVRRSPEPVASYSENLSNPTPSPSAFSVQTGDASTRRRPGDYRDHLLGVINRVGSEAVDRIVERAIQEFEVAAGG